MKHICLLISLLLSGAFAVAQTEPVNKTMLNRLSAAGYQQAAERQEAANASLDAAIAPLNRLVEIAKTKGKISRKAKEVVLLNDDGGVVRNDGNPGEVEEIYFPSAQARTAFINQKMAAIESITARKDTLPKWVFPSMGVQDRMDTIGKLKLPLTVVQNLGDGTFLARYASVDFGDDVKQTVIFAIKKAKSQGIESLYDFEKDAMRQIKASPAKLAAMLDRVQGGYADYSLIFGVREYQDLPPMLVSGFKGAEDLVDDAVVWIDDPVLCARTYRYETAGNSTRTVDVLDICEPEKINALVQKIPEEDRQARVNAPKPEPTPAQPKPQSRTWKDVTGKFTFSGALRGVSDNNVILIKTDGTEIKVPLDKLSQQDRDWLREHSEK